MPSYTFASSSCSASCAFACVQSSLELPRVTYWRPPCTLNQSAWTVLSVLIRFMTWPAALRGIMHLFLQVPGIGWPKARYFLPEQ